MSKPYLHIAHFTNTYLPVMSGVVRSIQSFRRAQEALGHKVFIFGQETRGYVDTEPFVFRYPALNIPVRNYPATIPVSPFIDWVLPILKLDVIHAHHPAPMGSVAADKAEKLNIPLVFTHHTRYQEYVNYIGLPEDLVKDIIERLLADYMKKCQRIIAPSPSIKRMIEETYGVHEGLVVLPTGIDLAPYQSAEGGAVRRQRGWRDEDKVVITVGRLAAEKNFGTLIEAMALVMRHHENVRLALIGEGPDRATLERLCRRLGIEQRVDFVGQVSFEEVPVYLKASDLFSFASITETQGLVVLEAMAAELPVVAVDATGTHDIIEHEKNGLLTANEAEALAEGVERVLGDPALAAHLKRGAEKTVREFEITNVTKRLIAVYHEAIEAKRAGMYIQTDERKPIYRIAWERLFSSG